MLNLTNWYARLNAFFCLSIITGMGRGGLSYDPYGPYGQNPQPTAAQIAAEIAKINPTLISSAPTPITYTPNQYTKGQLAQFNQPQGMQGNPFYQQYLNKMNGMGAGTGKNMPSIAPQPVAASPVAASIAPQPVAASPVAAAGGKNGPII